MFRSRFFWRLYLTYSLLVVVTAALIGLLVQRQAQENLETQIELRLRAEAEALVPLGTRAFDEPDYQAQSLVREIGAATESRITFITPEGLVLADSEEDPAGMENHAGRSEIVAAMRAGSGISRRFSATVQYFQLYLALRVTREDRPLGVIRVSIPLAEIDAQLRSLRAQIYGGAGIAILMALALGTLVTRRFTAPIAEMTRVSEALRQGDYRERVVNLGSGELALLGANLNRLAADLTDRLETLAHQRAQLDTIIGSMQEGVIAFDDTRQVVVSNDTGRGLLQVEPGESLSDAHVARARGLADLLAAVDAGEHAARREIMVPGREGEIVLDARAAPYVADTERGTLLVLYDITNLRRLERIRTDFVANVSHELKTPLTSIQGYVETLLDGAVHDAANNMRFLGKIEEHVRRLSALVSDLLSLARIESPTHVQELGPVDWRQIVSAAIEQHRDAIGTRELLLRIELGDGPTVVTGEAEGMRQIVDNLLDNAIKYTPAGGTLSVRVWREGGRGMVSIADTGIGIPEEALTRIFERFYRVDRGRSREVGGTGLGLSIVRNLTHRLGGHVRVRSEVARGSTFTVELPLCADD